MIFNCEIRGVALGWFRLEHKKGTQFDCMYTPSLVYTMLIGHKFLFSSSPFEKGRFFVQRNRALNSVEVGSRIHQSTMEYEQSHRKYGRSIRIGKE